MRDFVTYERISSTPVLTSAARQILHGLALPAFLMLHLEHLIWATQACYSRDFLSYLNSFVISDFSEIDDVPILAVERI